MGQEGGDDAGLPRLEGCVGWGEGVGEGHGSACMIRLRSEFRLVPIAESRRTTQGRLMNDLQSSFRKGRAAINSLNRCRGQEIGAGVYQVMGDEGRGQGLCSTGVVKPGKFSP